MLRKAAIIAFLEALVSPVNSLYSRFLLYKNNILYRLTITPQVCYLEKMLNDRFDGDQRRIYISDGVFYESLYLYTEAEANNLYIFTQNENNDLALYSRSESGSEGADFIVHVPATVVFDHAEMSALLDNYKLASKTYVISSS